MSHQIFTDRIRNVLALARNEAELLCQDHVGTEHLMLALLRAGSSVGSCVLTNLNVDIDLAVRRVTAAAERGEYPGPKGYDLAFDAAAKRAFESAAIESRSMKYNYVGTEHLLLGLLHEPNGIGARVLGEFGVTVASSRTETLRVRKVPQPQPDEQPMASGTDVALVSVGGRVRLVLLKQDGNYRFLDYAQRDHRIHHVAAGTLSLFEAVEELEDLINNPRTKESNLQRFFEQHPEFLLADRHIRAHPHIALEHDYGPRLIPDFILEPINQDELCDVLDIKLPIAKAYVATAHGHRLSAVVMNAVRQVRAYSDFFEQTERREAVSMRYGLRAFRPNLFIVIGRRGQLEASQRKLAQREVPGACILTYDDLIDRVRARLTRDQR